MGFFHAYRQGGIMFSIGQQVRNAKDHKRQGIVVGYHKKTESLWIIEDGNAYPTTFGAVYWEPVPEWEVGDRAIFAGLRVTILGIHDGRAWLQTNDGYATTTLELLSR